MSSAIAGAVTLRGGWLGMDGIGETSHAEAWRKLGAELRRLRTERELSLSAFARLVHYSKGYLSKLETGDKRITPDVAVRCDEALNTGGALAAMIPEPRAEEPASDDCPYRGLASFGPEDTRWFFGREPVTADLVGQLGERLDGDGTPLAVVAPSGAGKSSLLQAGLIPALARGALPGSRSWPVVCTTPTAHPLTALAAAAGTDPRETSATAGDPQRIAALLVASAACADDSKRETRETACSERVVLIVDQFEETFTECQDEDERRAFIDALCAAASSSAELVVLGLRADFYGRCLAYPALLGALHQGHLPLGSMTADQVREAITRPAEAAGLRLEPGLVELLLGDLGVLDETAGTTAGYEPGALPLLSHALLATWQQRDGRVLTVAGYQRAGGIRRAIATTAERVYTRLTPAEQQIAQQVFVRLVHISEQTEETRRRLPRQRLLEALPTTPAVAGKVLETFGRARLLTFDADHVQITHEALLRVWPRLHEWITTDRAGLRIHQQLTDAAEAWQQAGRDPSALYRGHRLASAREWAASPNRHTPLSAREDVYLNASIVQEDSERQTQRHRTRRLQQLVAALAVLLVLALAAGVLAVQQSRTALARSRLLIANELAAKSSALAAKQPDASMLLAVEAFHQADTVDTRSALLSAQAQYFTGELVGHTGSVRAVAFSPDGHTLATTSNDGTARLWDAASHQQIAILADHTGPVRDLAFSPDGHTLATAGSDNTVRLWDTASYARVGALTVTANEVTFSRDGRMLATAGHDGIVTLWDVPSRRQIASLTGRTTPIEAMAFSPDGLGLATGGKDGAVTLWDVASRREVTTLTGHSDTVTALAFSPADGHTLASVSEDKTVRLWDVASHQQLAALTGHTAAIYALTFSPDGRTLATAGRNEGVRLWDVASHRYLASLKGHTAPINALAISPDGHTLATASEDETVQLWGLAGAILIPRPIGGVLSEAFSPDGRILATTNSTATVTLSDTADHQQIATLTGHRDRVSAVAFSPDGRTLATASWDGTIGLWDVASHQQIATLTGHRDRLRAVEFSPDGRMLATTSRDGTVRLWDIATRQPTTLTEGADPVGVAFSRDGHLLAVGGQDGTATLWDLPARRLLATLTGTGASGRVAISPDGRLLATSGANHTVQLWDVAHHQQVVTLTGHTGPIHGIAFSPNGDLLATASEDDTARLWDLASHQQLATLTGHTTAVHDVAFSRDGRTLATASADYTVRLWDLDADRVTGRICGILDRILDRFEQTRWNTLIPELPYRPTCP